MSSDKRELKYCGIDYWSRPVFKDKFDNYFGSVEKLYGDNASFEDITEGTEGNSPFTEKDIVFFGKDFECDPDGRIIKADKIKLVKKFSDDS